jgi:hypothetical protein
MTEPTDGVRVRVTGPRTGRPRRASVAAEIDAHTELGEVYMRSLIRSQLRLAAGIFLVLVATVGMLPVAFRAYPVLLSTHVVGIPLPWLILGFGVYPLLILLAWFYVRRAERNEHAFNDLVGTP